MRALTAGRAARGLAQIKKIKSAQPDSMLFFAAAQ
jgi:hypothetical protein